MMRNRRINIICLLIHLIITRKIDKQIGLLELLLLLCDYIITIIMLSLFTITIVINSFCQKIFKFEFFQIRISPNRFSCYKYF